jgi:hypothetical protein
VGPECYALAVCRSRQGIDTTESASWVRTSLHVLSGPNWRGRCSVASAAVSFERNGHGGTPRLGTARRRSDPRARPTVPDPRSTPVHPTRQARPSLDLRPLRLPQQPRPAALEVTDQRADLVLRPPPHRPQPAHRKRSSPSSPRFTPTRRRKARRLPRHRRTRVPRQWIPDRRD